MDWSAAEMGKESQLLEAARDGNLPKVEVGGSLLRRGSPVLDHVLSVRQTASVRSRTYYTVMSLRWLQRLERKRLIYTDYTKCHVFVYSLKKLQSAQRPRQLVVCGVRRRLSLHSYCSGSTSTIWSCLLQRN